MNIDRLKFRVFGIDEQCYIKNLSLWESGNLTDFDGNLLQPTKYIFEPCMGTKDRDNTLIFEWDIATYCPDSLNYSGVIKYDQTYLYWYFEYTVEDENGKPCVTKLDFSETESEEYTITGTIHDEEAK